MRAKLPPIFTRIPRLKQVLPGTAEAKFRTLAVSACHGSLQKLTWGGALSENILSSRNLQGLYTRNESGVFILAAARIYLKSEPPKVSTKAELAHDFACYLGEFHGKTTSVHALQFYPSYRNIFQWVWKKCPKPPPPHSHPFTLADILSAYKREALKIEDTSNTELHCLVSEYLGFSSPSTFCKRRNSLRRASSEAAKELDALFEQHGLVSTSNLRKKRGELWEKILPSIRPGTLTSGYDGLRMILDAIEEDFAPTLIWRGFDAITHDALTHLRFTPSKHAQSPFELFYVDTRVDYHDMPAGDRRESILQRLQYPEFFPSVTHVLFHGERWKDRRERSLPKTLKKSDVPPGIALHAKKEKEHTQAQKRKEARKKLIAHAAEQVAENAMREETLFATKQDFLIAVIRFIRKNKYNWKLNAESAVRYYTQDNARFEIALQKALSLKNKDFH